MNDADKTGFKELLDSLSDCYQKDKFGKIAMQIYFGALQKFTIDQVSQAASQHLADTKSGQFFPKPADLIRHIEGGEITADAIIAAAKLANTPLGCLARIQIGTWDLDTQDSFYLRQRAEECIQLLPQWKDRASSGEYSDHEISIMLKYEVSPIAPFAFGLSGPENSYLLIERAESISKSKKHLELMESPFTDENDKTSSVDAGVKNEIARLTCISSDKVKS